MTLPPPDSLERLTHADLIGVVRDLIGEVTLMRAETEKLDGALAKLRVEHQAVKDELARLKHLPPRPPIKPSGMDKATQAKGPGDEKGGRSSRRRGSQLDRLKIGATIVVKADPPAGSRNKGFEDIVVQDLSLNPQVTRYRRERWETPDGKTIIAALDSGLVGGYGPNLHRLVLTLHFSGQVTCERIVAFLNGMGVLISKRQVVRLLTALSLERVLRCSQWRKKPPIASTCAWKFFPALRPQRVWTRPETVPLRTPPGPSISKLSAAR